MGVDPIALGCAGLTLLGLLQAGCGAAQVQRFVARADSAPLHWPPLTVLKPLHGDEKLLETALASFCEQDYPALQIVCGVQDAADPAIAVVRRMQARYPRVAIDLVIDATRHGSNRKVGNLANMLAAARYETLVISDSDIHAAPDYLDRVAAALQRPGVGLVTTLYTGRPATASLADALGAAAIDQVFLPGALLARLLGRQDCLGATMALTRATLERIGGFAALADHVADDAVLGQRVREAGLSVRLAATIPATTVAERGLAGLFVHELRWARTVRSVAPLGFALSVLQYPLFWALLAVVAAGGAGWSWAVFGAAWLGRSLLGAWLGRVLHLASPLTIWCLPLRDLLSVTVMLASYGSNRVSWRGQAQQVGSPRFNTKLAAGEG